MLEFFNYLKDENGQGMVEYGLIIGFIALIVIVALRVLGESTNKLFSNDSLLDALSK